LDLFYIVHNAQASNALCALLVDSEKNVSLGNVQN